MDRFSAVDRILAVSAIVSAIAAVAISVYQAQITREYQEISVWPYVAQYNSSESGTYQRWVENRGTGPALVKSFEVRVDGEAVGSWGEVIRALTGEPNPSYVYGSVGEGTVLLPGEPYRLLELPVDPLGARFHREIGARMESRICYCSLYGECWLDVDATNAEEERHGTTPVDACPETTPELFD